MADNNNEEITPQNVGGEPNMAGQAPVPPPNGQQPTTQIPPVNGNQTTVMPQVQAAMNQSAGMVANDVQQVRGKLGPYYEKSLLLGLIAWGGLQAVSFLAVVLPLVVLTLVNGADGLTFGTAVKTIFYSMAALSTAAAGGSMTVSPQLSAKSMSDMGAAAVLSGMSLSVTLFFLLGTVTVAVLTWLLGRRFERAVPSQSKKEWLLGLGATGLVFALLQSIWSAIWHYTQTVDSDLNFGRYFGGMLPGAGSGITLSMFSVWLFISAFCLAAFFTMLGRSSAISRHFPLWSQKFCRLFPSWRAAWVTVTSHVSVVFVFGFIASMAGLIYANWQNLSLVLMPGLDLGLLAGLLAMGQLVGVYIPPKIPLPVEGNAYFGSQNLFTLPYWWMVLIAFLVLVIGVLVAAIVWARVQVPANVSGTDDWWTLPTVYALAGLFLTFVVSFRIKFNLGNGLAGLAKMVGSVADVDLLNLSGSVGPSGFTFLTMAIMGAVVMLLGRYATPLASILPPAFAQKISTWAFSPTLAWTLNEPMVSAPTMPANPAAMAANVGTTVAAAGASVAGAVANAAGAAENALAQNAAPQPNEPVPAPPAANQQSQVPQPPEPAPVPVPNPAPETSEDDLTGTGETAANLTEDENSVPSDGQEEVLPADNSEGQPVVVEADKQPETATDADAEVEAESMPEGESGDEANQDAGEPADDKNAEDVSANDEAPADEPGDESTIDHSADESANNEAPADVEAGAGNDSDEVANGLAEANDDDKPETEGETDGFTGGSANETVVLPPVEAESTMPPAPKPLPAQPASVPPAPAVYAPAPPAAPAGAASYMAPPSAGNQGASAYQANQTAYRPATPVYQTPGNPQGAGAYQTAPTATPAKPMDPATKKKLTLGLIGAAMFVLLIVVGVGAYSYVAKNVYTPKAEVERYLQDIVDGRAEDAMSVLPAPEGAIASPLLTDAEYAKVKGRPSRFSVGEASKLEDGTTRIDATLFSGEKSMPVSFIAAKDGSRALIFNNWKLIKGSLLQAVSATPLKDGRSETDEDAGLPKPVYKINGVEVDLVQANKPEQAALVLLPGNYKVSVESKSPYIDYKLNNDRDTFVVEPREMNSADAINNQVPLVAQINIKATYKPELAKVVTNAINKYVTDKCLKVDKAENKACNAAIWGSPVGKVHWTLLEKPTAELEGYNRVNVRLNAAWDEKMFFSDKTEPRKSEVNGYVTFDLDWAKGKPKLTIPSKNN
ncbi:hypothetical protein BK816_07970 [Boudabousia tangfeifanii]|uniref:Uncharacterized protein n=1 Tax=Boudabousia tangfeifanii TaxID=1912795 RepID=A0A1D9MM59_9ACTO|nr:hypothetical protein [Boudabousia tangfeifanii]AOZ73230.1 hypothetical protein BK816_07970 [Boudabousia tangfeifanii]